MTPETENPTNGSASADRERLAYLDFFDQLPFTVPPLIELAQETFHRALPQLIQERPGQWVAYHGDRLVGFARTDLELYHECSRQGLKDEEYLVRCIELGGDEISFSLRPN